MKAWAFGIALLAVLAGCSAPDSAKALDRDSVPAVVKVAEVQAVKTAAVVPILGAITAERRASMGAEVDGRVVSLLVHEGERVKAGQSLIQIAAADAQTRLDAAKGGYEEALTNADAEERITRGKLTQAQLDLASTQDRLNSQVTLASAKLAESKAHLAQLVRGARPQEIERANADVEGAKLVVESDKQTADFNLRTLQRRQDLLAKGAVSQKDVDEAQLDYNHSVQAIHFAEAELRAKQLFANLMKEGTPKEELAEARALEAASQEGLRAAKANLKTIDDARQAVGMAQADHDRAAMRLTQLKTKSEGSDAGSKLRLAQQDLQRTLIKAPINGIVSSLKVVSGQVVRLGQALVEVVDSVGLRMDATALDQDVSRIKAGQPVTITLRSDPSRAFQGFVEDILPPSADEGRSFRVIVAIKDAHGLAPGLVANGEVLTADQIDVLVVPQDALLAQTTSEADVFVLKNGVLTRKHVLLGPASGDKVQITFGLVAGDQVVIDPGADLHDGSPARATGGSA